MYTGMGAASGPASELTAAGITTDYTTADQQYVAGHWFTAANLNANPALVAWFVVQDVFGGGGLPFDNAFGPDVTPTFTAADYLRIILGNDPVYHVGFALPAGVTSAAAQTYATALGVLVPLTYQHAIAQENALPARTAQMNAQIAAEAYTQLPNQVQLSQGVRVPQSAILDGPTTLPDGVIVTVYTNAQGVTLLSAVAGPSFVPAQLGQGGYLPPYTDNLCLLMPGTGGWYLAGALGYNCPQPPAGFNGDYSHVTATMVAAWASTLAWATTSSGALHNTATSSPLPNQIVPGIKSYQWIPNPIAGSTATAVYPLVAGAGAATDQDLQVSPNPSGIVPPSQGVVTPAVTTAPETDESGTLDVQVVPEGSTTPTGGAGTSPTVNSTSSYTPPAASAAMTGNAPTLGNSGLLLGLGALLVVAAVAGKKRS